MTTMEQRQARMETVLNKEGFRLHPTQHALMDHEGEIICKLSERFVKVLDDLSDAQALAVLFELHSVYLVCAERARKAGIRAGRAEIASTIQELLGVSRIERIGDNLQDALREINHTMRNAR